jgi:hypothetical protein
VVLELQSPSFMNPGQSFLNKASKALLQILLLTLSFSAQAQGPLCKDLFTLPGVMFSAESLQKMYPQDWPETENLHFTGRTVPNQVGGQLRALITTDGGWGSNYRAFGQDFVGYPLGLANILGSKVAYRAGFRAVSKNESLIPDADALNVFIKDASGRLRARGLEPLALRFYETSDAKPFSGPEYLKNFVMGALPLDKSSSIGIHDMSYHAASFLLPKPLVRDLQLRAKIILKMVALLEQKKDPSVQPLIDFLVSSSVTRIDFLGNQSTFLTMHMVGEPYQIGLLTNSVSLMGLHLPPSQFVSFLLSRSFTGSVVPPVTADTRSFVEAFEKSNQYLDKGFVALPASEINARIIPQMVQTVQNIQAAYGE